MFSRDEKKSKMKPGRSLKDLIAVESVEQLLKDKKRQTLLSQIKDSIGMSQSAFEKLAYPIIHNLCRYCQNLPETSLYYANRGGLIDRSLNRTEAALELVRQILVLGQDEMPTEEQKIWLYALFSAGMLQGIGKLYTDYRVDLFDANGQLIKHWQPLFEDLSSIGKYYYFDLLRGDDIAFRNHLTLMLAKQMMPSIGLTQLSSNAEVFAIWLILLQEGQDTTGPLAAILNRANAIAIQRDINEYLHKFADWADGRSNKMGSFIDKPLDAQIDKERLMGAEFIVWVTQGFESGKILINQLAQVVSTGIVGISEELIDMFVLEHKRFKNKAAIRQALLTWQSHLLTTAAKESMSLNKTLPFDSAFLPDNVKVLNQTSKKIETVSTLAFINNLAGYSQQNATKISTLNHLSPAGKWGPPQQESLTPVMLHHEPSRRLR